ncbi:hypothetical protein K7432_006159 [Basidiobolus ranarum]|uniref:Uncharacterized protein n=1 Tax=Basidiobolus ranarum TaxID=34480 RepID=A0ABR2W274_9FUNG
MNNSRQPHSQSSSTSPKSSQNFPPIIPVSQSLTSRSTFNASFIESVTSTNASGVEEKETISVVSTETNTFTTTSTSENPASNFKYSNNEKEKIRFSIVRKSAGKSANVFKNTLFQSTPEDDESQKQSPNVAVIAKNDEELQTKENVNLRPEKASKEVQDTISYNGTHRENSSRKRSRSRNSSQDIISQKKHTFSRESRSIAYESTPYRRYSPRMRSRSPHRYDSQWHYSPRGHSRSPQYYHRQRSRSPSPYRHYERRAGRSRSRSPTSRYQHYEPRRRRSRSRSGTPSQGYDNWRWRSAEHKRSYNGYDSYRRGYSKSRSRSPYSGYDSYRRRSPRSRSRSNSRPTGYHYQGSTNWSRGHNSRIQPSSGLYHKEPVSLSRKYENSDLMEERKAEHASNDRNIAPPPPPIVSPKPPPPLSEVKNPTPTPPPPPLSELKIPTPPPPPLPEHKNPNPPPPPLPKSKGSSPTSP